MPDRKRCCCNCRRNIRSGEIGHIECRCEIDGHYIGYVECFEGWCKRWAKDYTFDNPTLHIHTNVFDDSHITIKVDRRNNDEQSREDD